MRYKHLIQALTGTKQIVCESIYETEIEELRQQNRQMLSAMDSIIQCLMKYQ